MDKATKEILDKLPGSWTELKLKNFQHYVTELLSERHLEETEAFGGLVENIESLVQLVSSLAELPKEVIYNLGPSSFSAFSNKLKFMDTPPRPSRPKGLTIKKIEGKDGECFTLNNYIQYGQLTTTEGEVWKNMHILLRNSIVEDLSYKQILDFDMELVHCCFFLLRRQSRKSLSYMCRRSLKLLLRLQLKEVFTRKRHLNSASR